MRRNQLLRQLVENNLKTSSHSEVERYYETAKILCSSQISSPQPKSVKKWAKKWIPTLKDSQMNDLKRVIHELPKEKLQIYKLFDILKHSQKEFTVIKQNPTITRTQRVAKHYLTDSELVRELIVMLQGGKSGILTFIDDKLSVDGLMTTAQKSIVLRIARNALLLSTVQDAIYSLDGIIGQSVSSVLQKEKSDYITAMLKATNEMSLLALESFSCAIESQRLEAAAITATLIEQASQDDIFIALEKTQDHGSKFVREIGDRCNHAATKVFVEFIKEWAVFGKLDDPYEEFFVHEFEEEVENSDWWDKKYEVRSEKIPPFIKKDTTVAQIVASGRAWNFVREFKRNAMENGILKARRMIKCETEGKDRDFSLKILPECLNESMTVAMNIVNNVIWIKGHIKAVTDLILMRRGDFAVTLFDTFLNAGAPVSLLETAITKTLNKSVYTNPTTKDVLTDCLDIKLTASRTFEPDPESITVVYNAPNDLSYLLDDSMMQSYIDVGKLVWRLKCAERRLFMEWKISKNAALFFSESSSTKQPQDALHFEMVTVIRAIYEFITMDVVFCSQRELLIKLQEVDNIDDLLKLVRTQSLNLKSKCFLTQNYKEFQAKIDLIIAAIDQMCSIEEDLSIRADEIADRLGDDTGEDFMTINQTIRITKENLISSIKALAADFHETLTDLYEFSLNEPELSRLESRLVFCVHHLIKE